MNLIWLAQSLFLLLNTMKNSWRMSSWTACFFSFFLDFHLRGVLLGIDHERSRIFKTSMRVLSFKYILKTCCILRINSMLRAFNYGIIFLKNWLLRVNSLLRAKVKFIFLHNSFPKIFCFVLTSIKVLGLRKELNIVSFLTNILRLKINLLLTKWVLSRFWTFSHHISRVCRFKILKIFICCCRSASFIATW